jgi:hypothetical protein
MSVISKTRAEEIAKDVFLKSFAANNEIKKEIKGDLKKRYLTSFPKDVQEFFKTYEKHFPYVTLSLLDHYGCSVYEPMPCKDNSAYAKHNCNELNKRWINYEAKEKKIKKACKDLEFQLLTLRTKKRILEAYPELTKYFKPNESTLVNLPAIQVNTMRTLIANQPI